MGILRTDVIAHSQLTSANASVLFDGSNSSGGSTGLRTADGDHGYALGSEGESITIECWIYNTSVSQTFDAIFATNNYGVSGSALILYNNNDGLYMSATGFASDYAEYGILEENTWYHIALVKENKQVRLYLDGVCKAYRETGYNFSEDQLCIGCSNYGSNFPTYSFAGYISNFRVNKRALYKENFTPSKFKLKNISGTTLLCCQDSSDDTTAAVGSIAAGGTPVPGGFGPDLKEDTTDTGVVFEDNTKFDTLSYMVPPGGTTAESNRGRGILFGGGSPGRTDRIDYIDIPSGGNSIDFGNLACGSVWGSGAGASSTRGVFWGGENQYTKLDYVTIATTANATSFGTSSTNSNGGTCMSSETRAVYVLGAAANTMEYVTIATTGNTTDFGDQGIDDNLSNAAGLASPTRGIVSGGYGPSPYPQSDTIEYITIATTGNGTDFGNLTLGRSGHFGASSTTRGVFAKGYTFPSPATTYYNTIEYITIASTGNATDFGDATNSVTQGYSHSSHTRGVFAAGTAASDINTIDYITIATTGNATDFGDTHSATRGGSGTSDCHGGIS